MTHPLLNESGNPRNVWYRLSLSYATFELEVAPGGRVVTAPPIARWTILENIDYVLRYYERKGAEIVRVSN